MPCTTGRPRSADTLEITTSSNHEPSPPGEWATAVAAPNRVHGPALPPPGGRRGENQSAQSAPCPGDPAAAAHIPPLRSAAHRPALPPRPPVDRPALFPG